MKRGEWREVGGRRLEWVRAHGWDFYNPTLVRALALLKPVRPVTLAIGMVYVLVPIQLFVSPTQLWRKPRKALT